MKRSVFAKILIMVLCLSLVLCACGKDDSGKENDPTDAPTSAPTDPTSGNPDGPEDPGNSGDSSSGLSGILGNIFGDDVTSEDLLAALECGKVTVTVGDMLTNVMYVDVANLKFVDELNLNVEGTEFNAQLYLNQHDLVVALPQVLPDTYGVSFDTLLTDLPTSAIWSLMGTSYDDFMEELSASLDEVLGAMDGIEDMFVGAGETFESLMTTLSNAMENVEQTTTTGQANIFGENVDATIISYNVDTAAMENVVNTLLDWCSDNAQDLSDLLGDEELTAQAIIDGIKDAKTEVAGFFDTADLDAALALNLNTETGALMSIDGSFAGTIDGVEDGIYLNLTLGVDPAESDLYSFSIVDSRNDGFAVTLGNKVEDTKTTYDLNFSSVNSGEATVMMTVTASYDTANNAYQLSMSADGESYAVNGTCKVTDETFEFTVDTLNNNGEVVELNLSLVAETISPNEIPNAPSYKNVLKMSEQELMDLLSIFQGGEEEEF